jgi:hypothetical protein
MPLDPIPNSREDKIEMFSFLVLSTLDALCIVRGSIITGGQLGLSVLSTIILGYFTCCLCFATAFALCQRLKKQAVIRAAKKVSDP